MLGTKVKSGNKDKIRNKFGGVWKWEDDYNDSPRGRIWLAWISESIRSRKLQKKRAMNSWFIN